MQVGKSNYNQRSGERLTFHKLGMKDDQRSLTVRVAPPVKGMAESGRFATYIKQHFGYTLKVGDKTIPRTFLCIERKNHDKSVVEECPECEENSLRKAELEAKLMKHKAAGLSDEEIKNAVAPMTSYAKAHNLDKKWHLLAKNEAGTWGFLTLSHKAYENFQTAIKQARALGIEDPLGVDGGCWFTFTRTGFKFNEITDTCTIKQESVGKGATQIKMDTLTEKDFAAIEALPELTTWGTKLTYDQIKMLVSSGGADDVVKSIFESSRPRGAAATEAPAEVRTSPKPQEVRVEAPSSSVLGAAANVAVTPTPVIGAPTSNSEMDALRAQMAVLQAKLSGQMTAAVPAPGAPAVSDKITKKLDLDVDEFLAEMDN